MNRPRSVSRVCGHAVALPAMRLPWPGVARRLGARRAWNSAVNGRLPTWGSFGGGSRLRRAFSRSVRHFARAILCHKHVRPLMTNAVLYSTVLYCSNELITREGWNRVIPSQCPILAPVWWFGPLTFNFDISSDHGTSEHAASVDNGCRNPSPIVQLRYHVAGPR